MVTLAATAGTPLALMTPTRSNSSDAPPMRAVKAVPAPTPSRDTSSKEVEAVRMLSPVQVVATPAAPLQDVAAPQARLPKPQTGASKRARRRWALLRHCTFSSIVKEMACRFFLNLLSGVRHRAMLAAQRAVALTAQHHGPPAARPVVARPVVARPAVAAAAPVTEVDGVRLHLSAEAASGYMGVTKNGSGFRARCRAGFGSGFRDLGTFTTAVEAAKAYALYMLQRQAELAAAALPIPTATGPQIEDVDD